MVMQLSVETVLVKRRGWHKFIC